MTAYYAATQARPPTGITNRRWSKPPEVMREKLTLCVLGLQRGEIGTQSSVGPDNPALGIPSRRRPPHKQITSFPAVPEDERCQPMIGEAGSLTDSFREFTGCRRTMVTDNADCSIRKRLELPGG
jgi:hypothetical protein